MDVPGLASAVASLLRVVQPASRAGRPGEAQRPGRWTARFVTAVT